MARKRKRQVRKEDRVDPTPETLSKLEDDPLYILTRWDGSTPPLLDSAGENAAQEIKSVYNAIVRNVTLKISSFDRIAGYAPEIPDRLSQAYSNRYKLWVSEVGSDTVDLVLRVIVDRQPVPKSAYSLISQAIRNYAKLM